MPSGYRVRKKLQTGDGGKASDRIARLQSFPAKKSDQISTPKQPNRKEKKPYAYDSQSVKLSRETQFQQGWKYTLEGLIALISLDPPNAEEIQKTRTQSMHDPH